MGAEFDFDRVIDRKGTGCIKYDAASRRGKPAGLLPLWVADMDFASPPCVLDALKTRLSHGVFGYSEPDAAYFEALLGWFETRLNYKAAAEWIVPSPGVVFALNVCVRAYTRVGDAVLIQQPVYAPFTSCVLTNGRRLVVNRLAAEDDGYSIDFDDFERQIDDNSVKLFILCSPHNPVGRVWREDELNRLGEICSRHGVIVVSDEIHSDFIYAPHRHTVFSNACSKAANRSIICTAPTKTFNLAGLHNANIIIQDKALRESFTSEQHRSGISQLNVMGLVAAQAAYESGGAWVDALIEYLRGNYRYIDNFLSRRLPRIKLIEPEGTYLAWLDAHELNLDDDLLISAVERKARLWLEPGTKFGEGGSGFLRLNFAAPRSTIEAAMERLETAFGAKGDRK